jgi:hypothetical protein
VDLESTSTIEVGVGDDGGSFPVIDGFARNHRDWDKSLSDQLEPRP